MLSFEKENMARNNQKQQKITKSFSFFLLNIYMNI